MTEHITESVRRAIITACRDAFHWRRDVISIFAAAGTPVSVLHRYEDPAISKARIARGILDDLRETRDGATVEGKVVAELCRMGEPHRDAPDQNAGRLALAELKEVAVSSDVLIDPDRAAADARQARARSEAATRTSRQARQSEVRTRFLELSRQSGQAAAERQRRGYDLEQILADLFVAHDLEYRRPYRLQGEQVDGSFHFRGFTYIVEVKWEQRPPDFGDLAKFKATVDGKMESTRGMFLAMAGFDPEVLQHFANTSRASRNNIILMDGSDLAAIMEGIFVLGDALGAKIDAAEQEGKIWAPLAT